MPGGSVKAPKVPFVPAAPQPIPGRPAPDRRNGGDIRTCSVARQLAVAQAAAYFKFDAYCECGNTNMPCRIAGMQGRLLNWYHCGCRKKARCTGTTCASNMVTATAKVTAACRKPNCVCRDTHAVCGKSMLGGTKHIFQCECK